MSFGINRADPFKSYSASPDAGGGLTGYAKRKKNQTKKNEKEEDSILDSSDEQDYDIDFDDPDFM